MKEEYLKKIETDFSICNVLIEQLNNIASNLDSLKENERLFIAMQRADSQLQSLENSLYSLRTENIVRDTNLSRMRS